MMQNNQYEDEDNYVKPLLDEERGIRQSSNTVMRRRVTGETCNENDLIIVTDDAKSRNSHSSSRERDKS